VAAQQNAVKAFCLTSARRARCREPLYADDRRGSVQCHALFQRIGTYTRKITMDTSQPSHCLLFASASASAHHAIPAFHPYPPVSFSFDACREHAHSHPRTLHAALSARLIDPRTGAQPTAAASWRLPSGDTARLTSTPRPFASPAAASSLRRTSSVPAPDAARRAYPNLPRSFPSLPPSLPPSPFLSLAHSLSPHLSRTLVSA
jgi:hypothetical protein